MKKKLIAIAMLATVAFSSFAVLAGCGGGTPATSDSLASSSTTTNSDVQYERIKEKVLIVDEKFQTSPIEIANLINANLAHYGYPTGTIEALDSMVMINFYNGDYIMVSDSSISATGQTDSDLVPMLSRASAEVLLDSSQWSSYYTAVSDNLLNYDNFTFLDTGTTYNQIAFDKILVSYMLSISDNYMSLTILINPEK